MNFMSKLEFWVRTVLNLLFFRKSRAERLQKELLECMESGAADGFLYILLSLMSLMFCIDCDFRKNIKDFNATYQFTDVSGDICVGAIFGKNKLKVIDKKIEKPTVTLIFKDGKSLIKFLLSGSTDILNAMLNQEINFSGNINYINKFAFMAIHLLLLAKGEAIL